MIQILTNTVYIARRDRGDGTIVDCKWPALIEADLFKKVQARLLANREKRPTGRPMVAHNFLLEGLLRCGSCGATMVRTVGTSKTGVQYFYYRCAKKHKTASQGCSLRDVSAKAVETFVLDQLSSFVIDPAALKASVAEVNAGRDTQLAEVETQLREVEAVCLQKGKQIAKLLDAVENGDGEDVATIRVRLKEREAELQEARQRKAELAATRDVVRRDVLEAETVAEAYVKVPYLLAEAQRVGAHQELRALIQAIVEVVEWRESPDNPKEGEALIQLYPLPNLLASATPANSTTPADPGAAVNRSAVGSLGCQDWLRRRVSNPRPEF